MKFSQKNIENWRSWKMTFFLGGHFDFFFSKKKKICFILLKRPKAFIWGIIFFCTIDGFFRILGDFIRTNMHTTVWSKHRSLFCVYFLMKELLVGIIVGSKSIKYCVTFFIKLSFSDIFIKCNLLSPTNLIKSFR